MRWQERSQVFARDLFVFGAEPRPSAFDFLLSPSTASLSLRHSFIMVRQCSLCHNRTFPTTRGFVTHRRNIHRHPKPPPPPTTKIYHPSLNVELI